MSSSKQVVFDCMYFFGGGFFLPFLNLSTRPRLQFILGLHFTPACVLLSVCSLHYTHSLHFTPGLQSAVRSLRFTLTAKKRLRNLLLQVKKGGVLSYTYNKMVGSPPYVLWWWFLLWQLLLIIFFSFQEAKDIKIRLYTPQLCAGQLHKVEASLHCPNTAAPHPQVSFPYGNCEQKCQKNLL